MSTPDPLWKRVAGGLCGIAIVAAIAIYIKSHGSTGKEIQEWEESFVVGVALAAGLAFLIIRRRS